MTPPTIEGRPVVVTGAGSGIGAALAREAAARGAAAVAVLDIDLESAIEVADSIRGGAAYRCDVLDRAAVASVAADVVGAHGVPALVCANAGVMAGTGSFVDLDLHGADWVFGVNVLGVLATLQAFGRPMMASAQSGWLLVTGSEHSLGVPHSGAAVYTASKHAVLGMADVVRAELPDHVGISVLCPGLTTSALWEAGRRRTDAFGGPEAGDPRGAVLMERGMAPEVVAQRAFDGVAAGRFVVATHANAEAYATARARDVADGFDALRQTGDTTSYDVGEVIAAMAAEHEAGDG